MAMLKKTLLIILFIFTFTGFTSTSFLKYLNKLPIEQQFRIADKLYEQGKLKEAAVIYENIANKMQGDEFYKRYKLYEKIATIYEKLKNTNKALHYWKEIADFYFLDKKLQAKACFKTGLLYFKKKKYYRAQRYLGDVVYLYKDKDYMNEAKKYLALAVSKSHKGFKRRLNWQLEMLLKQLSKLAVEAQFKFTSDKNLYNALGQVATRLKAVAGRRDLQYHFTVVKSKDYNAFAVPGGYIYVTEGLLKDATEDELAGVLGHEIGHVVCRHSLVAFRQRLFRVWFINKFVKNKNAKIVAYIAATLKDLSHSRENEYEADRYGIIYAVRAGYSPWGLPAFLKKIQEKYEKSKPSKLEALLRTHPITANRIKRAIKLAQQFVQANPGKFKYKTFQDYLNHLKKEKTIGDEAKHKKFKAPKVKKQTYFGNKEKEKTTNNTPTIGGYTYW